MKRSAPSTKAASYSSPGRPRMNWVSMNTAVGRPMAMYTGNRLQIVFSRFSAFISCNSRIVAILMGSIMPMMKKKWMPLEVLLRQWASA